VSFQSGADDDLDCVERCLRGETAAFRPLVERYQRLLFNVALRMLGDREDAADAAQTAFVRAYQKLQTFDHRHKFFSWLYRILVNECLNVRRRPGRVETCDAVLVARDDPAKGVEQAELREAVQAALLQLPGAQREAVVLRHYAGYSYREMAEMLHVPEKTIKSRLYSARQRLGELLLGWGERP
jgi:RNA polymerase sigma-70 factor (ECF subfamily)